MAKVAAWKWLGLAVLMAAYVALIFANVLFAALCTSRGDTCGLDPGYMCLMIAVTAIYITSVMRLNLRRTLLIAALLLAFDLAVLVLHARQFDIVLGKSEDDTPAQLAELLLILFGIPYLVIWLVAGLVGWRVRRALKEAGGKNG